MDAIKPQKRKVLFVYLFFIFALVNNGYTQVNETPLDRYVWNKKKSEMADGYVILRNGKRLDGQIQLIGAPNAVSKIIFVRDGKELELEPVNIKAYGLTVSQLVNDSPDEMYSWTTGTTRNVNGINKTPSSTKNMKGYLVLVNGSRKEGILHLNAINNQLDEFVIRTVAEGKLIFKPAEVVRYGLNPLISDITNEGERVFDEEGKNFKNGYYVKTDGTRQAGLLAFMKASDIRSSDASYYSSLFYTTGQDIPLTVINPTDLAKVVQLKGDTEVVYLPYNGGFVAEKEMAGLAIEEQFKLFQPGKIILKDNSELTGEVAQLIAGGQEYITNIRFKGKDGKIKDFDFNTLTLFEQNINNKSYRYFSFVDRFIYLIYDGATMAFYKNPFPTTINKRATGIAKAGASIAGTVGSAAVVNSVKGASDEDKAKTSQLIQNASKEELQAANNQINEMKGTNAMDKQSYNNATKVQTAMALESAGREVSENLVIMNVEYFVWNKKSNEKSLVIKSDFAETMETALKSCDTYLMLPKEDQKKFRKLENIESTMKMLDNCYK